MSYANADDEFASENFADAMNEKPVEKKPMSGCAIVGIGCGVSLLLLIIIGAAGAWWLKNNIRQVGTDFAVSAMKDGLKELDVPEDQRARMHARIDEVGEKFKSGELDLDQVGKIGKAIAESPIMSAGMGLFFKRAYLQNSGLSDEEKEAAEVSVQRFARGVIDKDIPQEVSESCLDEISVKDADGKREFKEKVTDDELRSFLTAITKAADDAGVPADVPEINIADEFDKAIDQALADIQGNLPAEQAEESMDDSMEDGQ